MRFKKTVGLVHRWLGLLSGLVVLILGLTGAIYCFEKELKPIFYPSRYITQEKSGAHLSPDLLLAAAQQALGSAYPVTFVEYYNKPGRTCLFRASKYNEEGAFYNSQYIYYKTAFVNPYTGQVQYLENTKWEFFQVVFHLHLDLLMNKAGHQIVGWSTVIFLIMLISGIILWWPRSRSARKQRFSFNWKKSTGWKRKNYDLHNIPGFYSLFVVLFIALTGLYFAFEWFQQPVRWIAAGGRSMPVQQPVFSDSLLSRKDNPLYHSLGYVSGKQETAWLYFISLPEKKASPLVITAMVNPGNYVKRNQYFFDQNTGTLLKEKPYQKQTGAERFVFMVYDIHIGKVLGLPGQVLALMASLVAASLPVTGFMIWWGRRKKNRKSNTPYKELIGEEIKEPLSAAYSSVLR